MTSSSSKATDAHRGPAMTMTYVYLIIAAGLVAYGFWLRYRQRASWQTLANQLGFLFSDGGWFGKPSMHGNYDGTAVDVRTEIRGAGRHRKAYTVVEADLNGDVPVGLEVYSEGFFQKMNKLFGSADIQVGDAQLDDTFIIKSAEPGSTRELLTQLPIKRALLAAHRRCSSLEIGQMKVRINKRGRTVNSATLREYIGVVVDVANAIDDAFDQRPGRPSASDSPPTRQPAASGVAAAGVEPDQTTANSNDWW